MLCLKLKTRGREGYLIKARGSRLRPDPSIKTRMGLRFACVKGGVLRLQGWSVLLVVYAHVISRLSRGKYFTAIGIDTASRVSLYSFRSRAIRGNADMGQFYAVDCLSKGVVGAECLLLGRLSISIGQADCVGL